VEKEFSLDLICIEFFKKINMKRIKIFLLVSGVAFLTSCESNTTQELSPVISNPTYAKNVGPVISASCTSCHSGGDQFPDLENYDQVKEATDNGRLLCKINGACGSVMPTSGKLPQATIDMIQLWATNNYPN